MEPPLARIGAEPGRVRLTVRHTGNVPARDVATLETYPEGAMRIVGPKTKPYSLPHLNAEATVDWELAFTADFIKRKFPITSTYNNARKFGVRVARGPKFPGRRATSRWMAVDLSVGSLAPLESLNEVAAALAGEVTYPVRVRGRYQQLAVMRFGVTGNDLAVHAQVTDKKIARHPIPWEGSCIEIFGAMPGRSLDKKRRDLAPGGYFRIRQLYLTPRVGGAPATGFHREQGRFRPAADIRVTSKPTAGGYELQALIPLARLGVDVDVIYRNIRLYGNSTPVYLMADMAKAGRFLLEARVTTALAPGGKLQRGTIFGSPAPHCDHLGFGRMRLERKVSCRIEVLSPISLGAGKRVGRVRLHLQNLRDKPLSDTVTLAVEPPEIARVTGKNTLTYTLQPREKTTHDFEIALSQKTMASSVYLVVPRSPRGQVVRTASPRLEIVGRPLIRLAATIPLTKVKNALAAQTVYPIRIENQKVAELRLAVAGEALAVSAIVVDGVLSQHAKAWKGSSLEVFGSMPGKEAIGQVFLVPRAGNAPAKGLRAHAGGEKPAPAIRLQSAKTAAGYELQALVPLELLALNARPEFFTLEFQVSSQEAAGGKRRYGTVFGSQRAYQNNRKFAAFRLAK